MGWGKCVNGKNVCFGEETKQNRSLVTNRRLLSNKLNKEVFLENLSQILSFFCATEAS